ncbi:two-component regulator propeller domain-containing protein [Planctobacterium marinum]|uniref:histidine kinase n=1 Tax=Planctobacterium marinum TaxID=1631968 RepID=A0AA48HKS0_9ALTE|nr:hybrid sensor histidine kinase/response regulator [Planctobacterium marinum]
MFAQETRGQLSFASIGDAELIPDNVVTDIAQDKQGFLWIATAAGLVRYDGYRFKMFEYDATDEYSIGGNFVRNINVFEDGSIWLSTEPGGVSIYHPKTERFSRLFSETFLSENPGLGSVSQVIRGAEGELWLATNSGVYVTTIDGALKHHYTVKDGLPHNGIRALLKDKAGVVWVGTRAGLARFSPVKNQFDHVQGDIASNSNIYIRSLFEDAQGRIWIGSNASGVFVYDVDNQVFRRTLLDQPEQYQKNTVYDIFQADERHLWIARFGGIDHIDAAEGKWVSRSIHDPSDSFSLANNDIRTLLKDQSGMIWVGGYGGGVQRVLGAKDWLKTLRFSLLKDNALTEPNVSSLMARSNGDIWVGTRGGGINIVRNGQGVVARHTPEVGQPGKLQSGWITALTEVKNGDIWVGVNPGQLYRYDVKTEYFHQFNQAQGLPRVNIRVLKPAKDGGIWIGSNSGLLRWQSGYEQFERFTTADGELMRDGINALIENEHGDLLVASGASGLYRLDYGAQLLQPLEGIDEYGRALNTISILGMLKDREQRLWLDTPVGMQLANFDDSGFINLQNVSEETGFGGRPMGANLLQDELGRIWSPSFVFFPSEQEMLPLQRADGIDIGTSWFRSYTQTRDGTFLFGGSRGLLKIWPERFSIWDFKPPIVASEVRVDGEHVNAGSLTQEGLTLLPGQRGFTVEFAALDLSAPEKNQYRYRLRGYESSWSSVDATRRIASYSNLWPGDYTFEVQGTNRIGAWSDKPLMFPVYIRAQYWQTPWFIGLCIFIAVSLLYLGFRIRTQWIKARAQALEVLVEERTRELRKTQKDFIEQEKMASLGSLVAGVSHEINTPMGIALTAATALDDDAQNLDKKVQDNRLKRSDLDKHISKLHSSNKIILSSLDRACSLIASFKQVAVDQTSEQRRDFELKILLQDIERALNSLYSKKGHKLSIDCPEDIQLNSYPGALFQILTNLINNSVLHGFGDDVKGNISIVVTAREADVSLVYKDDGVGMTEEVKNKAFEPFFTTRLGVGGSGLGMHLVYNYVSQVLGGKISIESAPNQGFTCAIQIPLIAPNKEDKD